VGQEGLSYQLARLGIDSWVSYKVYRLLNCSKLYSSSVDKMLQIPVLKITEPLFHYFSDVTKPLTIL
jgi:hypothetical protein